MMANNVTKPEQEALHPPWTTHGLRQVCLPDDLAERAGLHNRNVDGPFTVQCLKNMFNVIFLYLCTKEIQFDDLVSDHNLAGVTKPSKI